MNINENSGQIEVIGRYGRIFLYTYNKGLFLVHILYDVLAKRERWDDEDYLSRMIFCAMINPEELKTSDGFGIGTQQYIDIKILISLDIINQKIILTEYLDNNMTRNNHCTFEQFINTFTDNAEL